MQLVADEALLFWRVFLLAGVGLGVAAGCAALLHAGPVGAFLSGFVKETVQGGQILILESVGSHGGNCLTPGTPPLKFGPLSVDKRR